jgi:hypothetical protein
MFTTAALGVTMAATLAAQTIRIAPPVRPPVTDADVLVLHEYNKTTGVAYGTMPGRYVTEVRQRLSALLEVAVIETAYVTPPLYLDRETAQAVSDGSKAARQGPALNAAEATFNAMTVLRVQPVLGRDFSEADAAEGRRLVLLTAGAWQRLFRGPADIVGASVWSGQSGITPRQYEIIGVLPAGLMTANPEIEPVIDALVLAQTRFDAPPPDDRWFAPIVRLRPGVALETAQAAIDAAVAAAQRVTVADRSMAALGARLDTMRRGPLGK